MKKSKSKNKKTKKKKKIKNTDDKAKELGFDINKYSGFSNIGEIIVKNIFERLMTNVFIEINIKKIYSLTNLACSNYLIKEINSLLSSSYLSHEKENNINSIIKFNDNYLRTEPTLDECNISQPSPPILDRWKIYQMNIIKADKNIQNIYGIRKSKFANQLTIPRKSKRNISLRKNISEALLKDKKNDYLNVIKKDQMRNTSYKLYDSFPSFPIPELMNEKPEIKLSKQEEDEINIFREKMILQGEERRKERENMKRNKMLLDQKELEENNKYKGKQIGVTINGEIIFIRSLDVKKLKSEFLEIKSKMRNGQDNGKKMQQKFLLNKLKAEKEIEKNKDKNNIDYFKEVNKNKINRQIMLAGSSFNNFVPHTGVNLKQGIEFKSGGIFSSNTNRISFKQFEQTLDIFDKKNKENNDLLEINNENENKSRNNKYNEWNKYDSLSNDFTKSNNINSNFTTRKNFTIYNLKKSNSVSNYFERNSSFPDLYKTNYNSNNNENNENNSNSKMSLTKYNNLHNNMNKLIQTSTSFKDIFNKESKEKDIKKDNKISTTTNFFINFNKNFNNLPKPKKVMISFKKMQTFSSDIVNDNNWGIASSQERETINKNKILTRNIKKNSLDKNILRVRSNENEIYLKKMNIIDKLSYRKIEKEIKDFKDLTNRIYYKNSNSVNK